MWKTILPIVIAVAAALVVVALFTRGKLPAAIDATKASKAPAAGG
jgi:hypothetical protein